VVGSLSSTTALPAAVLAGRLQVNLISPGATDPQLSDKFKYPTFLRTVPSYAVFAQVLAQLLQRLQWKNILVVYTDNAFGHSGQEQLLMAMYDRGLCVSQTLMLDAKGNKDSYKAVLSNIGNISTSVAVLMSPNRLTKVILQAIPSLANLQWVVGDIDITNDLSSLKRVRGAMVVVPRSATVDEFRQYFTQLLASPRNNAGNPWFADWFETTYGCSLTAGNCPTPTQAQFVQSPWVVPIMKAVFAYAEAVRSICNNGVCARLTSMTPAEFKSVLFSLGFTIPGTFPPSLRGQNISFDSNGDPQTSAFTVYNYNNRAGTYAFEEIGRFESNTFTLASPPLLYDSTRNTALTTNPTATCASLGCQNCLVPQRLVTYRYRSGDLVIASLINAHEPSRAPYTCGAGRASQLASLVAAEWAVQQYKISNPSQFLQVNVAVAQGFITDVLSGNNRLTDSSGAVIPASSIQAFVDATSNQQAKIISPIISDYNISEVMADVSTSVISRGGDTPYFTRAAPSDEVFYSAISNVLQGLGWKYVQVATHLSGEYREMADTFTRVAASLEIFLVLISLFTLISGAVSQLQLVAGTSNWGTDMAYLQGLETLTSGVIVGDLDLTANTAFSSYLQGLTLANIAVNPFLRELFEITNQCSIDPASQGMYARICTSTDRFTNFAQFNSESQTLSSFSPTTLGNYQSKLANCSGVCMECEYLSTMRTSIYNTGDWLIAGSFAVSNSGQEMFQPFICGDVRTSYGPQYTMAMLYALQQVNAGRAPVSVKGVKFGGWIFDHCGNPGRADLIVSDNKILAWLTDTNESSNETVQILDPLNVATISPSATADSLMKYPTFFRTIQGDAAAVTALILIAKAMKYNYIQVVYSANAYGRDGMKLLVNAAQAEGVCVTNQLEFTNASDIVIQLSAAQTDVVVLFMTEADLFSLQIIQRVGSQFTYPIMSLQMQRFNLSDYNAYINSAPTTNPFFAQFYMKTMQCNLPGYSTYTNACSTPLAPITSSANYVEDNSVLSTINAIYSVVDALHRTVSDHCGTDYTKPCSAFLAAPDKRRAFNSNLNNAYFVDDGKRTFRYLVREGATTFDILQYSSSVNYNKVGSYSGQSLDITDAAQLKYTSIESTCSAPCLGCIMTGITFSHIPGDIYLAGMFDVHQRSLSPFTCGTIKTLHGFLLLEAFHYAIEQVNAKQGQFANILPGVRLGGIGLDACESDVRGGYLISNIHSGITTLSKEGGIDQHIYIYTQVNHNVSMLSPSNLQISYGSGSEELSDKRVYPFFYRTVPTDANQILYEDNSNGLSAMQHFVARATNYSICVAETVPYPDLGIVSAETSTTIVARLVEKPTANTVVTFLSTQYVNSVLKSIAAFENYINQKNLANSKDNPWFPDYFQNILNCYISKTNTMGYPMAYSDVVYVINAVYAAAYAIHKTLESTCGANYNTVCQSYRANSTRHEMIRDNLANVSFTDPAGKDFMFVNRSGVASYRFNYINPEILGYTYKTIGSYNLTSAMLMLDGQYRDSIQSDCNRPDACAECPAIRDSDVRYVFYKPTRSLTQTIVAFLDVHHQGVDPFRCGEINVLGFQQLVTLFYTLEKLFPAVNYRILVIDTCSNSLRVDQDLFGLLDGTGLCNSEFDNSNPVSIKNIGGVIAVGEPNTVAASRVLELPGVTYLSPNALTTLLDSKQHLVRTIAPISAMMKTLVSLLKNLGWTYFSWVIFSFSWVIFFILLGHFFHSHGSFFHSHGSFFHSHGHFSGSRVVVLLGSYEFVKNVLATANAMNIADRYLWVLEIRLITLGRLSYTVGAFITYMNSLRYSDVHAVGTGSSIPMDWFDEFYQKVFDCRIANFSRSVNLSMPVCDTNKVKVLLNSVLSVERDLNTQNLNIQNLNINPQNVSAVLKFDKAHRWWDSGYLIKYIRVKKSADGSLDLISGDFSPSIQEISNMKALLGITSVCNEGGINPCDCTYEDIEPSQPLISQPFTPTEPRNYYYYHADGKPQYQWPIWAIVVAIITSVCLLTAVILFLILIFAYPVRSGTTVLGYMSIIGIIGIYAINFAFFVHATDATCGARRFLMGVVYMIAVGPLLVKAVDNWRFRKNNSEKERYSGISSAFVLFVAAVGVVLLQCIIPIIWLILVHPTATEWKPFAFARHDHWWCDPPQDYDTGLVQSFIFVMFIILVTAVFSALTFDSERNNFESRLVIQQLLICFFCIATAGCFLVWMIVSTSATPSVRDAAVSIGNLVNATLLLLAMPLRKCILLCQHLRYKEELEDAREVLDHHNGHVYNDGFDNPMLDLNVYDNHYGINGKPSEY
ncbi:unnamed protein product, partial [Candidula unifasciata]